MVKTVSVRCVHKVTQKCTDPYRPIATGVTLVYIVCTQGGPFWTPKPPISGSGHPRQDHFGLLASKPYHILPLGQTPTGVFVIFGHFHEKTWKNGPENDKNGLNAKKCAKIVNALDTPSSNFVHWVYTYMTQWCTYGFLGSKTDQYPL